MAAGPLLTPASGSGSEAEDDASVEAASALLRALAAPVRMRIVRELTAGPCCVHELVDATGAAQPLVSQHLRVLRISGLVRTERRGREVVYSLADAHVGSIVADAVAHAGERAG